MSVRPIGIPGEVCKLNDELKVIYGWASVITKDGIPVEDSQGDKIRPAVLEKTAHDFVTKARKGGFMHVPGLEGGQIVASIPMTYDLQKSLGIVCKDKDGKHIEGWLIGYKCGSDALWKRAKAGDFAEFSIGGQGVRIEEA